MSLQFILGSSGSGKSRTLYETVIRESMERPKEKYLVIVPEQFTLETQKQLVELHPRKGIWNIDVLSFQRLALRVLEDTGADRRKILEETGKNLVLRRCAMEHREELTLLSGSIQKPGYITQVKSMISELSQYNIEPEDMDKILSELSGNPKLYYKFQDLKILYEAFQKRMEKEYVTAEEVLEVLAEHAEKAEMLSGCTIALDGFTGFTPIQQKLLLKLLKISRKIMVTVTLDPREEWGRPGKLHELFYLSKKTIHSLVNLSREAKTELADPVILQEVPRFQGKPGLSHLEKYLFRSRKAYGRNCIFPYEPEELSIHGVKNPNEEIHFAARTILKLTREGECTYGDIALISGDMETYAREVRRVFPQYGIPCFIDETRKVLLNPFLEYIKAALELILRDYSYESVFRFLRTGMSDFSPEEIDFVENYVLAAGIRGYSSWKKTWEKETKTFQEEELTVFNQFRERFVEKMSIFTEQMKKRDHTVRERAEALYEFMVQEELQQKLYKMEQSFSEQGKAELAREYQEIYGIVLALLDKMVEFLGEETLSLREFQEILEAGFEEAKIGMIPPSPDEVLIGNVERTRLKQIKVLIFLGMNEGVVPSGKKGGGLLSEREREILEESGVTLAPGERENSFVERFYLYLHLTKPSKRLYLTFATSSMDGKAMSPSYVLKRIQSLFPKLTVRNEEEEGILAKVWTPQNGLPCLAAGMQKFLKGEQPLEFLELYRWYAGNPAYETALKKLSGAAFPKRREQGIGREAARALYGTVLVNSVSRLESFASCSYAHFLQYGLRLSEREKLEFAPVDMGNLFHRALEIFSEKVEKSPFTWFDLPDEEAKQMTEEAVDEAAGGYTGFRLMKDSRSAYALTRVRRIMGRTIWALLIQIRSGIFKPSAFEVSFAQREDLSSVNIALSSEEMMRLKGRIDRIDACEQEENVYVKVVDYKSGNTRFDLAALYYGLQLQLVVYLNAAMELEKRIHPGKEVIPAGIFYYNIKDPILEMEGEAEPEKIREQILKELRVNGVVNDREEILDALDRSHSGNSRVIPVSYLKNGSLGKTSKTMNTEEFSRMSSYVNKKLKQLGEEILKGNVEVNPYQKKEGTACDYCEFREVCGFDPKTEPEAYRRLKELSREEVLARMEEEE